MQIQSRAISFFVGAIPRLVAPMPEMTDNSSVGGVGTGALPLQNPRFFENEIALRSRGSASI